MPDPTTPNKLLFTPAHNADINTWDVPMNANYNGLDQALGTYTALNATGLSGTIALTTSQTIPLGFIITGTPTGPINYQTPAGQGGIWLVRNRATLGASVTLGFSSASGGSTVTIPAATNLAISADGTVNGMVDINTKASLPGGSNTQVQVNIAGILGGYAGFTFNGTTLNAPAANISGNATVGGNLGIGTEITYPDSTTSTTAKGKVLQLATVPVNSSVSTMSLVGTYTNNGVAPTTAAGAHATPFDLTFTPTVATSILEIYVSLKGVTNTSDCLTIALFNGTSLLDYSCLTVGGGTLNAIQTWVLSTWITPGSVTPLALKVYVGTSDGNPLTLNSFGGSSSGFAQPGMISWLSVKEIQSGGP